MGPTLARTPRPGDPVLFLDVDGVISVFGLGRSSRHVHGWRWRAKPQRFWWTPAAMSD